MFHYLSNSKRCVKNILFFLPLFFLILLISCSGHIGGAKPTGDPKVYLAFGFHGNLYHSFRVDTNDEAGFGKDIRIMRKTIETLDAYNQAGVPVKGVWDIENLFSLQETLPKYAPDIIENIKRRISENGDEVILMSYNNGLASASTKKEFMDSMQRAIRNPQKSGLLDIFGTYGKIVRPQEMMTTPGNFNLYKELGIEAISLYYSSITFDAFRVFVPPLSMEAAHNPLLYKNKDTSESITVIPTYNVGDLIENISLRHWVKKLRKLQQKGEINGDVLIFINFDADDEYWYGYNFPAHLAWLPNTGGLNQLIDEVDDLSYVKFTNVTDYLQNHPPKETIFFGQDTADGSFNGYTSWSEKAYIHNYWTHLVKDRRNQRMLLKMYGILKVQIPQNIKNLIKEAYETRIRLLSTTNYGMATPYLAKAREQAVEQIIHKMNTASEKAISLSTQAVGTAFTPPSDHLSLNNYLGRFLIITDPLGAEGGQGLFLTFPVSKALSKSSRFLLKGLNGRNIPADRVSFSNHKLVLFISNRKALKDGTYDIYERSAGIQDYDVQASAQVLQNEFIRMNIDAHGRIQSLIFNGKEQLSSGSLLPVIHYEDKQIRPTGMNISILNAGEDGMARIRISGDFTIPQADGVIPGCMDYDFTLIHDLPYLFVSGRIQYPETLRKDLIKSATPALARLIDKSWKEVAPLELVLSHEAVKETPFRILKRNYLGIDSAYDIDYFQHSPENLNLANINQHITAEYIAATNQKNGMAVGMDTTVTANFAFCPIKMRYNDQKQSFSLKLNPFGTYFGRQYYQPTWSNRQGFEAAFISGQQYESAAPTYNGHSNQFSLMLAFFKGKMLPKQVQNDLLNFAHPPMVINVQDIPAPGAVETAPQSPKGFFALYGDDGVYFHWEKARGGAHKYKIRCGMESNHYPQTFEITGTMLHARVLTAGEPFALGQTYYAVIEAIGKNNQVSPPSPEIRFTLIEPPEKSGPSVPLRLQLKILWSSIKAKMF